MKKERIEYLVDSFVDANGDERHFVIAAVSEVFTEDDEPSYVTDIDGQIGRASCRERVSPYV